MKKLITMLALAAVSIAAAVTIQQINGPSNGTNYYNSPYNNQPVSDVEGIVTALKYYQSGSGAAAVVKLGGFYLQSVTPDDDIKTSEGIFVYLPSSFSGSVAVGDKVKVSGKVKEYSYVATSGEYTGIPMEVPIREIVGDSQNPLTVTFVSGFNPVVPVKIGTKLDPANPNKRIIPVDRIYDFDHTQTTSFPNGQIDVTVNPKPFDPVNNGLDFWRSMQGMLVEVDNAIYTAPTYITSGTKKTTNYLLADNGEGSTGLNSRGGITIKLSDRNPEMIAVEPGLFPNWKNNAMPMVETGAKHNVSFKAVVDYSYGAYKLYYTDSTQIAQSNVTPTANQKEVTNLLGNNEYLTISSFNVENLNPMDDEAKFNDLAKGIVLDLKSPNIIGIEEIQDNDGTTNTGTVAADQTFNKLINFVVTNGGPKYKFAQVDPINNADGGASGGNIRCGFLYDSTKVTFVPKAAPTGTNVSTAGVSVEIVGGQPSLSWNPGRIDPTVSTTDSAWAASRKPLVAEFIFNGKKLFIVANHFNSKGGDAQKYMGRWQPVYLRSEKQRMKQAVKVRNFVQGLLAASDSASIVLMGDFNDFQFSNPIRHLTGEGTAAHNMFALDELLPENERYAYVFSGNSQALDHIIVSKHIWDRTPQFDVVHMNAEYNDGNRLSDHDPEVARIRITGTGSIDNKAVVNSFTMTSYPNPFNPSTTINYSLANAGVIELAVYNVKGDKVATLVNGHQAQGNHSINFNAANLPSGIYFSKISSGTTNLTQKLMLVK